MVTIKRIECDVFGWRKRIAKKYLICIRDVETDDLLHEWTPDLSEEAVDRVEQAIKRALAPTKKVARERASLAGEELVTA